LVGQADNSGGIVHTDIDFAALRIGKSAYPFQVIIVPT
jgi:hypothetical protein